MPIRPFAGRGTLGICLASVSTLIAAAPGARAAGERPPVVVEALKPVSIARADQVIGGGAPQGIDVAKLRDAFCRGGTIVFDTGGQPATVKITERLYMPQTAKPIVLDGMGLVTLDGDERTQIILKGWKTDLTVQRVRFVNARAEKEGGAIGVENWDGRLTVIDCQFENCRTTSTGPDIGGGALRPLGQRHAQISGCTFTDCAGSNGGAICSLGSQLTVIDCTFTDSHAFGYGGGADRGPTGQGGIGGAIYVDGVDQNAEEKRLYISGCHFKNSHAGDHAGAIFGYTRPKQNSLSVYNACIFEGSVVDKPRERGLGMAGAVYTQYCRLYVTNCSFYNNTAPRIDGALFIAQPESVRVSHCEFVRNRPEFKRRRGAEIVNVKWGRLPVSPPVAYLGRAPGPVADGVKVAAAAPKRRARKTSTVVAPPSRAIPTEEALSMFGGLAQQRAIEAIAAGQKPTFNCSVVRQVVRILGADEWEMRVEGTVIPLKMQLSWDRLTTADNKSLALAVLREGNPADHAVAAFFLTALGRANEARDHLARAGEYAALVEGGFVRPATAANAQR